MNSEKIIILAGATGDLGSRIADFLLSSGVIVRALVRKGSSSQKVVELRRSGVNVIEVDYGNKVELTKACEGGFCVVSALSGVREVIVNAQTKLLHAALAAGVRRFIPSDFCIDYTKLPIGSNRNLDLRREFCDILEKAPIESTSILNGMFSDLLTGEAPVVLFGMKRILHWGSADQLMDFTTIENTAEFTAAAALDPKTPRFLYIAGEVASMKGLKIDADVATGEQFRMLRVGGLGMLATMIKISRTLFPKEDEVFPPWQGMQYLHNMLSGLAKMEKLDNDRYPHIRWTPVREVLAQRLKK
ncbi:NmrA family NAD(P)-binding protein [Dyadobacter arcticus]|uniref:NmrA-like domain-containing protein n=1 Tax=Dyadobacter arcticus TaxID=1078754 RepID=A0ABX0UP71_9BACT|nr:NmrA family NAD(P)-binding protein [Dyadobacter arcticus]NIJ54788.1 hypothetical protein [Dyadobacter arcticus]